MKNGKSLLTIVIVLSLTATSCKKDFSCECNGGLAGGPQGSTIIEAASRNVAERKCEANNPPPQTPDGLYCELK